MAGALHDCIIGDAAGHEGVERQRQEQNWDEQVSF
jgi:hypothetical protein